MNLLSTSLNKEEVCYLIHGQPFILEYSIDNAKYVIIYHKIALPSRWWWKRFCFAKAEGTYQSVSNAYAPEVRIYAFSSYLSLWPKIFRFPLKINFVNTITYQPLIQTPKPPSKIFKIQISSNISHFPKSLSEPQIASIDFKINKLNPQINSKLIQYP